MDITKKSGKFMAEIKSTTISTKAPNGSFEAVLSVPSLDRDKEIVDAGAFAPLPEHITIDIDHAMSVEKTVGSGRPFYDGDTLKFEGTYASHPLAQMVRSLVDEGHIRTMSVAYMNANYELGDDGVAHLRKAELLNAGIVGIPANREALITASKSLAAEVVEAVAETKAEKAIKSLEANASAIAAAIAEQVMTIVKQHISTETTPETAAASAAATPAPVDVASLTRRARVAVSGHALT